jgi:hypothetical protein
VETRQVVRTLKAGEMVADGRGESASCISTRVSMLTESLIFLEVDAQRGFDNELCPGVPMSAFSASAYDAIRNHER